MKSFVKTVIFFLVGFSSKAKEITTIKGVAPAFAGKTIEVRIYDDHLSKHLTTIASSTVGSDSIFKLDFYLEKTSQVYLFCEENSGFLYVSPAKTYGVLFPQKDRFEVYKPSGNKVELILFDIEKDDINSKIDDFTWLVDNFIAKYYTKNNAEKGYFANRLDLFKDSLSRLYSQKDEDVFFTYYKFYTIATLEDLNFIGSRPHYEKYDQFLADMPIDVSHEQCISYVDHYYDGYLSSIPQFINEQIYQGVIKSSPSEIMNAMRLEYTCKKNLALRELVMLKLIQDNFYKKEFPQSNLLTVLDSMSRFALTESNRIVAKNLYANLTQLLPGQMAPDFALFDKSTVFTNENISKKHQYFLFIDPSSEVCKNHIELLKPIYSRYKDLVDFIVVVKKPSNWNEKDSDAFKASLGWKTFTLESTDKVFKTFQVTSFPSYTLIDSFGYVVSAPALGPVPNSTNLTIDRVFYDISEILKEKETIDR